MTPHRGHCDLRMDSIGLSILFSDSARLAESLAALLPPAPPAGRQVILVAFLPNVKFELA